MVHGIFDFVDLNGKQKFPEVVLIMDFYFWINHKQTQTSRTIFDPKRSLFELVYQQKYLAIKRSKSLLFYISLERVKSEIDSHIWVYVKLLLL